MAVKGIGYLNTTWTYGERPVASAKLNLWDARIEAAIELVHFLLNQAWGGGEGVIRGATVDDLAVNATATPGMSVVAQPGYAFIAKFPYKLEVALTTGTVEAPVAQPRIDLVQARLAAWDVSVKAGVEAASPVAPEPDDDCIALATLYCRVGMTCIKDADDGTNAYVTDARQFV